MMQDDLAAALGYYALDVEDSGDGAQDADGVTDDVPDQDEHEDPCSPRAFPLGSADAMQMVVCVKVRGGQQLVRAGVYGMHMHAHRLVSYQSMPITGCDYL